VKPGVAIVYACFVALLAHGMSVRLAHRPPVTSQPTDQTQTPSTKGQSMNWSETKEVTVPAKPAGLWTWGVDYVKGPARILVEATGTWIYSQGKSCGPDGDLVSLLTPDHMLFPKAPVGALLVKVGGSTASTADGTTRIAGSKVYFEIGKDVAGPVLFTINDEPTGMVDNSGELKVTIKIAAIAEATPTPAAPAAAEAAEAKDGK
jgi:hypothetical protein